MKSELEILSLIEEIDKEFIKQQIPMKSRALLMGRELSLRLGVNIPFGRDLPNNDLGNLASKISYQWCNDNYGDKQKINFNLGSVFLKLKGEVWKFDVPLFYGQCSFHICTDISLPQSQSEINILTRCKELTPSLINTLTDHDFFYIFDKYMQSTNAFTTIDNWRQYNLSYSKAIFSDFCAASQFLSITEPHYGQAKWSFLQVAEKIIKSWLEFSAVDNVKSYNHNIEKLIEKYNTIFSKKIPTYLSKDIKTMAGVRYDQIEVSLDEVLLSQSAIFSLINCISNDPR